MDREQGDRDMTQAQTVRKWAADQGYEVGARGRLTPTIWEAYANAHDGFSREKPSGSAACSCGRNWAGLRECHCTVCHRHFGSVTVFDAHRVAFDEGVVCVDPLDSGFKAAGYPVKIKDTVWGPMYITDVGDREHYMTADGSGLYDEDEG